MNKETGDQLTDALNAFCTLADIIGECDEIDSSGHLPSECKTASAQWWAWAFGNLVARFVLHDKEWRDTLFCEGEYLIDGKPTKIWAWDEIWGGTDDKGSPDRKIPLVVGSLLSDYDDKRNWKQLRDHYVCMWDGSYTSYGKPLSEVGPEDDLYWAMRIGFADKMLEAGVAMNHEENSLIRDIIMIKNEIAAHNVRSLREKSEANENWEKLWTRIPETRQSTRLHLEEYLGTGARLLPPNVLDYCVEGEQTYSNGNNQSAAILSFAKAVESCLECYLYRPLVEHLRGQGKKSFPLRNGQNDLFLHKPSLSDWACALDMLANPTLKNLSDLGIPLPAFLREHLGTQRLPDFHTISEPLHVLQKYRNKAAHHSSNWENPGHDLEQTRSLVLGMGKSKPLIIHIQILLSSSNIISP